MVENSKIEWTHHTFNPWIGCSKVSPGCENCYAETLMDTRYGRVKWGPKGTRQMTSDANWKKPLAWDKAAKTSGERHRVFCASLADVFEDFKGPILNSAGEELRTDGEGWFGTVEEAHASGESPVGKVWHRRANLDHVRQRLFDLIDATPNLDWLLLTKRPENVLDMTLRCQEKWWFRSLLACPSNVWIGTSIEDQKRADERIPHLLKIPAAVRFLSMEPLLGPVDLQPVIKDGKFENNQGINCDWVIVGGESGQGARPCRVEWVRRIVQQCQAVGVPCFVKQLGANVVTRNDMVEDEFNNLNTGWPDPHVEHHINGFQENYQGADCRIRLRDSKGGDWNEWPEDLRVREFPLAVAGG